MRSVWKFQFHTTDRITVEMPKGAEVLCVQMQDGIPCMWAMVDTSTMERERRLFRILGTGHPADNDVGKYVGTYQMMGGSLVFHVFEEV